MTGKLKILRIEIDSHFHGSAEVPRPWVAQIGGPCPKYGLVRTFLQPLNDWSRASRTWRGRSRGVVSCFSLRGGHLYEVSRLRGKPSKRHVARAFLRVPEDGSAMEPLEAAAALAVADPCLDAVPHLVPDGTSVALIRGIGTPRPLGFVVIGAERLYQLRPDALHEVIAPSGAQDLIVTGNGTASRITSEEALRWLQLHQ